MTDIKFRAWDKKHQRMYHILTDIHALISGEITRVKWCTSEIDDGWLDDFILMQFTGLKDKNAKDIYFKDFVQIGLYICCVEWDNEQAKFYLQQISGTAHNRESMSVSQSMEIIRNLYENPELIKDSK